MKPKRSLILCMVGLVGSGKSTVAKSFARGLKAEIVRSDDFRLELGKQGKPYERAVELVFARTMELVRRGRNVVIDADVVQADKRRRLARESKKLGSRVLYVRVVTDMDVMLGRIVVSSKKGLHPLFSQASSAWEGPGKGAVIKIRELWRRTPHHYRWTEEGGGQWVLRELTFPLAATVDTTDGKTWKGQVAKLVKRLN